MAYIGQKPADKPVVASDLDATVISGQTALTTSPADTDEFLISDAGVLKRLDASLVGGGVDGISSSADATAMTIDSSENIGIGETTPLGKLHVKKSDTSASADVGANVLVVEDNSENGISILSGTGTFGNIFFGDSGSNTIGRLVYNHADNSMRFTTNNTEHMRIDSSGNIIIHGTASAQVDSLSFVRDATYSPYLQFNQSYGASKGHMYFQYNTTNVGNITSTTSSTAYNTSSDYRLKENVNYDFDATSRLKQLKPARFNFIIDKNKTVDGFLAHEVSSIVPEAISGEKDAIQVWKDGEELPEGVSVGDPKLDKNGNELIDVQSIDQSKLVPLLVKTIQELEARITELENA